MGGDKTPLKIWVACNKTIEDIPSELKYDGWEDSVQGNESDFDSSII